MPRGRAETALGPTISAWGRPAHRRL